MACQQQQDSSTTPHSNQQESMFNNIVEIERLDDAINQLIPESPEVAILGKGFDWSEGPVWVPSIEALLFSDVPANTIYLWKDGQEVVEWLSPSGYTQEEERGGETGSNGLILDLEGNLILCQHGDRRVARFSGDYEQPRPEFETIVGDFEGKKFNSPNDVVIDRDGNLYFTDPPYGLEYRMEDPKKEIPFQGVYRYSTEGVLSLITDKLTRPNGIILSPDESTLYVANSDPDEAIWMAYSLNENGEVDGEELFFDVTDKVGSEPGLPDGMAIDQEGNLFATGPGGIFVFAPGKKHLGTIHTPQASANCTFGREGNTLFITSDSLLLSMELNTIGLHFGK